VTLPHHFCVNRQHFTKESSDGHCFSLSLELSLFVHIHLHLIHHRLGIRLMTDETVSTAPATTPTTTTSSVTTSPTTTTSVTLSPTSTSRKGRKPHGELVWVKDGKTEYMAQVMEPIESYQQPPPPGLPLVTDVDTADDKQKDSEKKSDGNEDDEPEIEVRWTHNGVVEWVPLSAVRLLDDPKTSVGQRRRQRQQQSTAAPSSTTKSKEDDMDDDAQTKVQDIPIPALASPSPPSSPQPAAGNGVTASKKRKAASAEEMTVTPLLSSTSMPSGVEQPLLTKEEEEEPSTPMKKKAKMGETHYVSTFFSAFTTQATSYKNLFLLGCQEIYKELLGPS